MNKVVKNGIPIYRFNHLNRFSELRHGVFTRRGGVSAPPFDSLNVTLGLGDNPEHVSLNRRLILQSLGDGAMVFARQVHGNRILVLDRQQQASVEERSIPIADALITATPGLLLTIQVADCQPILLFDRKRHVVANVHAGWRGSVADIPGRTIEAMITEYGCRPSDIQAGIGPSLGPCCAEFCNYKTEIPVSFWRYKDDRDHFDFWELSVDQLCAAGLRRDNIEVPRICTRCATHRFFSYRAEKNTGRFAAVIGLK